MNHTLLIISPHTRSLNIAPHRTTGSLPVYQGHPFPLNLEDNKKILWESLGGSDSCSLGFLKGTGMSLGRRSAVWMLVNTLWPLPLQTN